MDEQAAELVDDPFRGERAPDAARRRADGFDVALFWMLTLAAVGVVAKMFNLHIRVGNTPSGTFAVWIDGGGLPSWWPMGSAVLAILLWKAGLVAWCGCVAMLHVCIARAWR